MPKSQIPIFEFRHVSFRYEREVVLEDITFSIQSGDYVGLVGSNGSGKTTLLKILLGIFRPTVGQVFLFGQAQEHFHDWQKIGYVPQYVFRGDQAFPATVREIVESGHPKHGFLSFCSFKRRGCGDVRKALKQAGILRLEDRRIGELSGGERQRVFIARALMSRPELLVLDEPTTGIDQASEKAFYDLLGDLNQAGMTIVLVSHDIEAVARQVKKVICLNRRLICFGSPSKLEDEEVLAGIYGPAKKMLAHHHDHV